VLVPSTLIASLYGLQNAKSGLCVPSGRATIPEGDQRAVEHVRLSGMSAVEGQA
jgi:hypothetical protein